MSCTISPLAGIVRVWNNDQLSSREVHNLNITVSDGVFSARTRLTVTISPENSKAPSFLKNEYRATVVENAPSSTSIITVTAHDPNMGSYGQVSYRLLGDTANTAFSVDKKTGQ